MGEACGNATQAARMAGYKQPQMHGSRMLKNDAIQDAISSKVRVCPAAASRHELQDFWTSVMYDQRVNINSRLKASELLAKSQGCLNPESSGHELMMMGDEELIALTKQALKQKEERLGKTCTATPKPLFLARGKAE